MLLMAAHEPVPALFIVTVYVPDFIQERPHILPAVLVVEQVVPLSDYEGIVPAEEDGSGDCCIDGAVKTRDNDVFSSSEAREGRDEPSDIERGRSALALTKAEPVKVVVGEVVAVHGKDGRT